MSKPKLLVVAHTNLGSSLSGGDRIFLNLIKQWSTRFKITVLASPEAIKLIQNAHLHPSIIQTTSLPTIAKLSTFNLFIHHFLRFVTGKIFCLKHRQLFKSADYIYTSSDFYGDFVFGVMAKIFNQNIKWLCGYYLLAPFPTDRNSPYNTNHHFFRGLIYYFAQLPTVFLANKFADKVFVTSAPDLTIFPGKSLIVQGGVYIPPISKIKLMTPSKNRPYDAFYLGRLHNQKGIIEMIDIWHLVTQVKPSAKLVIVGDGELMEPMIQKIEELKLQKNIKIIGFLVGSKKYQIIRDSKIVIHPATYDSGGMAAAEAMAWGLPGVSFDLPALKTYYPQGMIKTTPHNIPEFTDNIIRLLTDEKLYQQTSIAARQLIVKCWGWEKRFADIYQALAIAK